MKEKVFDNNQVKITGRVLGKAKYNHEIKGESFYIIDIEVERLSNVSDIIPIMISERLINLSLDYTGLYVKVEGQFRSYNKREEYTSNLKLFVFTNEIEFLECAPSYIENEIILNGYICKPPIYRKTPSRREISDILLAVNRPYGKSDYIPCICWGRNARFIDDMQVGTNVHITGRIQSREYQKKINDEEFETRIAYEVSVNNLKVI